MFEVDVEGGAGFSGDLIVGDPVNGTDGLYGSGPFQGSKTGTSCRGSDSAGLAFQGTCGATSMNGTYTISGQHGTFSVSSQKCTK